MNHDIMLSVEQLASLAEWADTTPGMAPVLIARTDTTETVLVGQGDDQVQIDGSGAVRPA